ncbi:MAG TPA: DNA-formamidopyrimidine glycosylase family protein [Microthrixaceae bacterium]|nr:hypothetical protein [Microthrixaceae bacterium]HNI35488.1 DNA-formamidopyrimidine glycosylase family protein [Microthrixaceae bacterium]
MPELIEVEMYRVALDATVGRSIAEAHIPDRSYPRFVGVEEVVAELVGSTIVGTSRRGKLAIAELDSGRRLGLRFGMTGRLIVDGAAPIDTLEYSSDRDDPAWDRFIIRFCDGGVLRLNDPRRFGSVELDPSLDALGPDASTATVAEMVDAVKSDRSVKAVLLDQSRVAGLGNLLVDETLWRAAIAPTRTARTLDHERVAHLRRVMRRTIAQLTRRGGSHRGDLHEERHAGGVCPRDGEPLLRQQVAGRTTIWCSAHQT